MVFGLGVSRLVELIPNKADSISIGFVDKASRDMKLGV